MWLLVAKAMCRRTKHSQQLYAYSQNTYKEVGWGGGGGGGWMEGWTCACEMPLLEPPMSMVLQLE